MPESPSRRSALIWAAAAAAAVLLWQAATVHFNYGGNWTGLFCSGDRFPPPPELAAGTYLFRHSNGFDGQFYRYVAHDPWFLKGWSRYHDHASLRYPRILVPALAWFTALGNERLIDAAYIAWILAAVFLGAWWLGRWAALRGRHPAWGLAFVLLPATLISIDRMTVDVALVALCAGVLLYTAEGRPGWVYALLVVAPLARDTGLLVIGACMFHALAGRKLHRAAAYATAALPALAWWAYAAARCGVPAARSAHWFPGWFFERPIVGIVLKLFQPTPYPFAPWLNLTLQTLDTAALCGFLFAFGVALWRLRRWPRNLEDWMLLPFAVLTVAVSATSYWNHVYNYGRPLTPLLLLILMPAISAGPRWLAVPILLIDLPIAAQCAPQALAILRELL